MSTIKKAKTKKAKATVEPRNGFEINTDGSIVSEEERIRFIDGDRERRIVLESTETKFALEKLEDLSNLINEKTERVTDFYRTLEDKLREFEIGYPFILKDEQGGNKDVGYQLSFHEGADGSLYFWRLGYSKLSTNWYIVAHLYRVEKADPKRVEGPAVNHVLLEDSTVRLTHASRDVRIAAAHYIGDFVRKFLSQVEYNENTIDCALKRIEKLEPLMG